MGDDDDGDGGRCEMQYVKGKNDPKRTEATTARIWYPTYKTHDGFGLCWLAYMHMHKHVPNRWGGHASVCVRYTTQHGTYFRDCLPRIYTSNN